MASSKADRLNLSYMPPLPGAPTRSGHSTANNSPVEQPAPNGVRSSFSATNALPGLNSTIGSGSRIGTGSPSHDLSGSRIFSSKRAREIQAQEGVSPSLWGPPTSGNSTPLRENIPESPTDGFPDFSPAAAERIIAADAATSARRARAGTVPSRFSPGQGINGLALPQATQPKTSRPTPSTTPFKSQFSSAPTDVESSNSAANTSALLSRLRSGSLPQRNYVSSAGPFGPTLFSTNWANARDRSTTLSSIRSGDGPASPAQSSFSKDGLGDNELRTLDYLGLADTPQTSQASLAHPGLDSTMDAQRTAAMQPFLSELAGLSKNINRYRSYSVNAKEKYAEDEDADAEQGMRYPPHHSGSLTPSAATIAAATAATHAQIHQHNLEVQAYVKQATAQRPRARTAGVLDSPVPRTLRSYLATPSRLDSSITAADLPPELLDSIIAMQSGQLAGRLAGDPTANQEGIEGPTRALWLGSIPASTTVSSLNAIFGNYGKIESARVLTHKNCGFVNFEQTESAVQAKSVLNGKEIFPGAGPIRIGYAKVPDTPASGTPGHQGAFPSPSPDPFTRAQGEGAPSSVEHRNPQRAASEASDGLNGMVMATLPEMHPHLLKIVKELNASEQDQQVIAQSIEAALQFDDFQPEIPAVGEPSHNRIHDAPKLREYRKRIENGSCSPAEIEEIAKGMLPEIAELSSDYLGNTVVQKLFEFCPENVKDMMLAEIAPHLAEIGVHKNGTWAAQKIIDVAKTPNQMSLIIKYLRPYTVGLFLDQYGNYVLQCCLRFGSPWNNFIFESMLSQMWEIAQGRFGARAMRACLESHHSTKEQQRMLAAAIALNSVQLATNTNGALLLTWFLDTCTFPKRRTVLAPRLIPHLVQLCTHKVAYLTVLKVINQRNEPEARDLILKALFFSPQDEVLSEILKDHSCGATLIFKVLTTPFFDESLRSEVVQNIRNVLIRLKAQPAQGYKRLMDEVGLSTRSGASASASRERPQAESNGQSPARGRAGSQTRTSNNQTPQQPVLERSYSNQYFPNMSPSIDPNGGIPRNQNLDQSTIQAFEQFGLNSVNSPMFTPNPAVPMFPLSPQVLQWQQQQQQQQLLAAQVQANSRNLQSAPFYGAFGQGLGGYTAPSPSMDSFRLAQGSPLGPAQLNANAALLGQQYLSGQQFNPSMNGSVLQGGFPYSATATSANGGIGFFPQQQQQQPGQMNQNHGGHRRGRVRS